MLAYLDNNFLIDLADTTGNPTWRSKVMDARSCKGLQPVLSPWNIYEIGNNTSDRMDKLVEVAETLSPTWIFERADLQLREGLDIWSKFWGTASRKTLFEPFGTLAHVSAALFRCCSHKSQTLFTSRLCDTVSVRKYR